MDTGSTDGRESVPASRNMRRQKIIPLLLVFLSKYEEIHEWIARTLSLPLTVLFSGRLTMNGTI